MDRRTDEQPREDSKQSHEQPDGMMPRGKRFWHERPPFTLPLRLAGNTPQHWGNCAAVSLDDTICNM